MIYFVQSGEGHGYIKIGYASNVDKRLKTLKCASPHKLMLLGSIPGDRKREAEILKALRKYNVNGEWFRNHPAVFTFMNRSVDFEYVKKSNDNRAHLLLWRDNETSLTDPCPFCGSRHQHGTGDGHRGAHCRTGHEELIHSDGTAVRQKDGYFLQSRNAFKRPRVPRSR